MDVYSLFKSIAFKLDPEWVHDTTLRFSHFFPESALSFAQFDLDERYETPLNCMKWRFPVGLAAGLDKNAYAIEFFQRLYFGAVEVGTVTPMPQDGNPCPRLFRLKEENSLRNCMGFNNHGMMSTYYNIKDSKVNVPLGVNLGKNKWTLIEQTPRDYKVLYDQFNDVADYMVINVSSPNTPGLRKFQGREALAEIFDALRPSREKNPCPLFLKIAPDLELSQVDDIIDVCHEFNLNGLIGTNTTSMPELGVGGVSGELLFEKAALIRKHILKTKPHELDFIGVGGFSNFEQMMDYWSDGGKALQIYSSFIYQGPKILKDIKQGIDSQMNKLGVQSFVDLTKNLTS